MSSPLLNNTGIVISLVILISLSMLCHFQNWITPSNSEVIMNKAKNSSPLDKLNNAKKLKELKENYQTIRDYANFQCNKKNCRNDLCEVIHAELPDELLRSCGTGPEGLPKLTNEQLRIFLLYNYLKAGKYALLHKIETQGGKL